MGFFSMDRGAIHIIPKRSTDAWNVDAEDAGKRHEIGNSKHLSYRACLEQALKHNLSVRIAGLSALSVAQNESVAQAAFDPTFDMTLLSGPGGSASGTEGRLSLNKRFATGAEIRAEVISPIVREEDSWAADGVNDPNVSLAIRQPLLRGAGMEVNRAGIDLARISTRSADVLARAEVMELLRATITAYWTVAWAHEVLLVEQQSLEGNQRVEHDVSLHYDVGIATKIDLLEAKSASATALERVERARQLHLDSLYRLAYLMGMDSGEALENLTLDPLLVPRAGTPQAEMSYQNALRFNPQEALLANEVERRSTEYKVARNNLLPALDMEINTGTRGFYGFSQGLRGLRGNDEAGWNALVSLSIPWTFRAERAQAEQTRLELERSEVVRKDGRRQLRRDIHEACREIESGHRQMAASAQALEVNHAKWVEQAARQKTGLISVRDLREAEAEFQTARVRTISAQLAILIARARLVRLEGSIVERSGLMF
jgi:outer membrane protein